MNAVSRTLFFFVIKLDVKIKYGGFLFDNKCHEITYFKDFVLYVILYKLKDYKNDG